MRVQLPFDSQGSTYVLAHEPAHEPPGGARFERLGAFEAASVLVGALHDPFGQPNWRLLDFLEIREHPNDLGRADLERRVSERVERHAAHFSLHRERAQQLLVNVPVAAAVMAAIPPALPAPKLDFIALQLVDDEGALLGSVQLELALANGEHRTVTTAADGRVSLDAIEPGSCSATLVPPKRAS